MSLLHTLFHLLLNLVLPILLPILPFCAVSTLLLVCGAKPKKKAKNKKKQKKEKNKDAEPKTAIEVPEGMLKQKEVKDNDNRVPVNKLVQLPPATQYPLLAKDKSTIVCTLDGTSQMTTLNTTSQIQMPRTLESRSYLTGKTKEEANAVIPPPKQQQTATQTMMEMGPTPLEAPIMDPDDAIFTDDSGGGHEDEDETQKPTAEDTQRDAKATTKLAPPPTVTAAPKTTLAIITAAPTQKNSGAQMGKQPEATTATSVPDASTKKEEPVTAQSTRAC